MQTLALVKNTTQRDFKFNVKIQDKITSHKRHRQSSEPIKFQGNHVIDVKRGKTCAWLALLLIGRENGARVSVQNKKRRKAKPKRIRITLIDIEVKTTLASPLSTKRQ